MQSYMPILERKKNMPERELSVRAFFPAGTTPSLEEDLDIVVVVKSDDTYLYVNGEQVHPEGGEE